MRELVRTEIGLVVAFTAAVLVAYVSLAVLISGRNRLAGGLVLLLETAGSRPGGPPGSAS